MKIAPEKLARHINNTPAAFYMISGEELLLREEAVKTIIDTAKQKGFTEHKVIDLTQASQMDELKLAFISQSLWDDKSIIECRLLSGQLNKLAEPILLDAAAKTYKNKLLVIVTGKLTTPQQNSKWYQALEKKGVAVTLWKVNTKQFPTWLKQRLALHKLSVTEEALQLLSAHLENNLLAARQMIEKLALVYGNEPMPLDAKKILSSLTQHARYSVFDLTDAIQQKQLKKITTILDYLHAEGIEPPIVLWALTRDYRQKQQTHFITKAMHVDQIIKGIKPGNTWDELQQLCFAMTGKSLFKELT